MTGNLTTTDYRARIDLDADADAVFDYLSDVANLPSYFDRMTSARPARGGKVHVTAQLGDRTEEGEAWFRVDREDRTLAWGSEGPNDYHGRLSVSERGLGTAVAVIVTTGRRAEAGEIQQGLDRTVAKIKCLFSPR